MFSSDPPSDSFEQNLEKRIQAEILPPIQELQKEKKAFVQSFWPNATPTQVFLVVSLTSLLLTRLLSTPQKRVEEGLGMLAEKIVFWDKPKRRRKYGKRT